MDSPVALALISKAKRVFENKDTFLSFPLCLSYSRDTLTRIGSLEMTATGLEALGEFSRTVNLIPDGGSWPPAGEKYLWDVYADIFENAKLGASTRTPEEERDLQKVFNFLHAQAADGTWEDSPEVKAYNQWKDAWYRAQEDVLAAEAGPEQELRRAKLHEVEQDWEGEGYRSAVEQARRVENMLREKSSDLVWSRWQRQFQPDIDLQTTIGGARYAPASFTPSNILDGAEWQKFTLRDAEIGSLLATAPQELKTRYLPDEAAGLEIDTLSFEYASVGITRPWFVSEVFTSRFWKFYDPNKVISDGANPAAGICPAYTAGLVFARNLAVKPKPSSTKNDAVFQMLQQRPLALGFFRLQQLPTTMARATTLQSVKVAAMPTAHATPAVKPIAGALVTRPLPTRPATAASTPAVGMALVARGLARLRGASFVNRKLPVRVAARVPVATTVVASTEPKVPSASATPAAEEAPIYVIAFICRKVPKCPDPDPNLQW